MRYDHKSKTTYLDFNTRKAPENSPTGVNFLSQKYSPPVVSSPPEVNPTFIENSENSPPEVNFLSQNFSPPEVNRLLYTKNNHLIMETISSQGEDAVIQYLSTVPCVEYLIFCHDEQKLDISPTVYNIKFGEESAIVSAKRNLKKEKKRQPIALFSATHGHLGCQNSNCPICVRKMGNKVKLQNTPNCSMKERKRGFRWRLDTCTFDQRNFEGEKYAFILRDSASDAFEIMHGIYRNDFLLQFKQWVYKIRSDPRMQGESHVIVSMVKTDFDGVWRDDAKEFQKEIESLGVIFDYAAPERKEGGTESNVNIFEQTVKAILMERNLPGQWWGQASRDAAFLLNRFPTSAKLVSPDGDAIRPLEYLTGGVVSRRQIDRELDAYVTLGTLCLVHNEGTKGSQLAAKVKYGVSYGMIGAINRFKCPFVGSIFRSASYTIVGLPSHISYAQFLGLPEMSNRNCMPKAVDLKIDSTLICKLPTPREWQRDILRDIVFTDKKNGVVKDDSKFYIARKSENGLQERDYSLTDKEYVGRHVEKFYEGHGKFKGEITGHDIDRDTGDSIWEVTYEDGDIGCYNHPQLMTMLMPTTHVPTKNILKIDSSPPGVNFDFDKSENDEYVTKSTDTFQEACLRLKIDPAHHKIYHDWLPKHVTDKIKYPFLKGHKNNIKMTAGMHLPTPHLSTTYQNKIQDFQAKNIIQTPFKLVDSSINTIIREQNIKSNFFISSDVRSIKFEDPEESPAVQLELLRKFNTANKIASFQPREHKIRPTIPYLFYVQASDKKLLHLAPINDRIMPPESVADAVDRKDIELILESWDSEMTSLGKFGAITHNHTRADLIKMGISTPPIPTRMLSDVKYKDGEFEKYKGRMIAQGFRMIKGVHFDGKTFSPTPNQHTNKILMALVAGEDLGILSFDISLAYTLGERDPENYPGGTKIA